MSRIFILNPEKDTGHIISGELANQNYLTPADSDDPEVLEAAIKIAEKTGNVPLKAHAIGNIGAVHYWRGQYKDALKEWVKCLELSKKNKNQEQIVHYSIDVGYYIETE